MTIHITPEITKAFDSYLDEEVDWDMSGQKILRRHTIQWFNNPSHGLIEFAAGWQSCRKHALRELSALHEEGV